MSKKVNNTFFVLQEGEYSPSCGFCYRVKFHRYMPGSPRDVLVEILSIRENSDSPRYNSLQIGYIFWVKLKAVSWDQSTEFLPMVSLDSFTLGYIQALFFYAPDNDDSTQIGEGVSFYELPLATKKTITEECAEFQKMNKKPLAIAFETCETYTPGQAGIDFLLTRNNHGAGYWDRHLGEIGITLADACDTWGQTDLYEGDDGLLYLG